MKVPNVAACALLLTACGSAEIDDSAPVATPDTASPRLQIGIMVHVETQLAWQDPAFFDGYIDRIRNDYLPVLEAHGARFTWEFRTEISAELAERGDPLFDQLRAAGQGIGVHADKGYPTSSLATLTGELTELHAGLAPLVPELQHVSGICSEDDWVTAALDAGFAFTSGNVAYCAMSLPIEARPAEYADCASPATCHDTFPSAIEARIHPWRAADGASWLTPSPSGLVILPSSGGLVCAAEEAAGTSGNCKHTSEDSALHLADVDAAIAARDPAGVNIHYASWSYGAILDLDELETWLSAIDGYVADGRVEWATLGQMHDSYVAR